MVTGNLHPYCVTVRRCQPAYTSLLSGMVVRVAAKKSVRVFIASPGDLAPERQAFKAAIDQLNLGFGDGAGVEFLALGWEDTLATTGRRTQGVINREIEACDVFVLAMHRRWGQPAPDSDFSSYTEEEFQLALARFKRTKTPEIFVFFKQVDAAQMGDAGPELTKVLRFRKELEETRAVLYRMFVDTEAFQREVDHQIFCASEFPRDKSPQALMVRPELRKSRINCGGVPFV